MGSRNFVHFVASTVQEKQAWISDISQCIDNIHLHHILSPSLGSSSAAMLAHQQSLKSDSRLFKDDVDIRFSRTLNSCKLPQVRYATPERLLQRLTDLRFLSIDFLNTFLLTYRVFTDGETVLNALKKVFYELPDEPQLDPQTDFLDIPSGDDGGMSPRRTSGASSVSGYCSEGADRDRSLSCDSTSTKYRLSRRMFTQQSTQEEGLSWIPEGAGLVITHDHQYPTSDMITDVDIANEKTLLQSEGYLSIPTTIATSSSADTFIENIASNPSSPSNLSSVTLVGSTGSGGHENIKSDNTTPTEAGGQFPYGRAPKSPLPERIRPRPSAQESQDSPSKSVTAISPPTVTMTTTTGAQEVINNLGEKNFSNTRSSSLKVTSSNMSPQHNLNNLSIDRRPSVGCNIIPHAALFQHRHSLQINGDSGVHRVKIIF